MASNYTGDADRFSATISLMTGGDAPSAALFRTPLERLTDNCAWLRTSQEKMALRIATSLRPTDAAFTDSTTNFMSATCLRAVENCSGPVLAIKTSECFAVYDSPEVEAYPGSSIPNLTSVGSAAVNADGRIVVVGATSPYCAYKVPGGNWTGGGNQLGNTGTRIVYSPAYDGFFATILASANVFRSADATSWASADSGLTGAVALAVIGAGSGAGRLVALSNATTPTVAVSSDNGSSFSAGGTIPYAGIAQEAGALAGCPVVTRDGLNGYVYHAARCNGGTEIRMSRSADGVTWQAGPVISAPAGIGFGSFPTFHVCQSTGLMAMAVPSQVTGDSHNLSLLYTSLDFLRWAGPSQHKAIPNALYAVAGGRVLMSPDSADLHVSDAVVNQIFA